MGTCLVIFYVKVCYILTTLAFQSNWVSMSVFVVQNDLYLTILLGEAMFDE